MCNGAVVEAVDKVNKTLTNSAPVVGGFAGVVASFAEDMTNLVSSVDSTPSYIFGLTNVTANAPPPTGAAAPLMGLLSGNYDLLGLFVPRSVREQNWAAWLKALIAATSLFYLALYAQGEALNMLKQQLQLPSTTFSSQGAIPGAALALLPLRVAAIAAIIFALPAFIIGFILDFDATGIVTEIISGMSSGGPAQAALDAGQGTFVGWGEMWAVFHSYIPVATLTLVGYLRISWQVAGGRVVLLATFIVRHFPT